MMISTEDIDQMIEAAFALVEMISNVRSEISLDAVFADDHTILLVTEIGCPKPRCAIFFIQHAAFFENGQGIVYTIARRQALFGVPAIKCDAELRQVVFNIGANGFE